MNAYMYYGEVESFKKKLIDLTGYALYNIITFKNVMFKNSLIIHKGKKNKEIKV